MGSQLREAGAGRRRVVLAAMVSAGDGRLENALAQRAVRERPEGRLLRRVLERQEPPGRLPGFPGGLRGRGEVARAQARELLPVGDEHRRVVGVGEQPVGVVRRELGLLLVERAEPGLVGVVEPRAGADELALVALDEVLRLLVEAEALALVVERLDAEEEFRVQVDRVAVRGVERRDLGSDLLQGLARVRLGEAGEDLAHPGEQLARAFHRLDRVGERRSLRVLRDALDLRELSLHPLDDRGLEVRVPDLVELRRLERQRARGEEGVRRGVAGARGGAGEEQGGGDREEAACLHGASFLSGSGPRR